MQRIEADTQSSDRRLLAALVVSVLLHALLLAIVRPSQESVTKPLEVSLVTLPPIQTNTSLERQPEQIVSQSEKANAIPPKETALRAETDSTVPKQQIRRGMPDAQPAPAPQAPPVAKAPTAKKEAPPAKASLPLPQAPPKTQAPKHAARTEAAKASSAPKLATGALRLNDAALAKRLDDLAAAKTPEVSEPAAEVQAPGVGTERPKNDAERARELRDYQPFRHSSAGSVWNTRRGDPDHLPAIQDGEVTLLNTKADRFAVFVRRVALQVFGSLRQRTWIEMNARTVLKLDGFAVVEAVMSPEGKLIRVDLRATSGVKTFDTSLLEATRTGSWDQNPPSAARAADGNIHFVFQARLWARRSADAAGEQRWLLLSTGLL